MYSQVFKDDAFITVLSANIESSLKKSTCKIPFKSNESYSLCCRFNGRINSKHINILKISKWSNFHMKMLHNIKKKSVSQIQNISIMYYLLFGITVI